MTRGSVREMPQVAQWLAVSVMVILALMPPSVYFAIAYQAQAAAVETEARINARLVTQLVNANPHMWRFEAYRLEEILSRRTEDQYAEARRILDKDGIVVAEHSDRLEPPLIVRSHWLYDSGLATGRLEIRRSIHPVVARTVLLALASTASGLLAFFLLRVFPVSVVRDTLDLLSGERGRAEVTLRSIGDGVITTGTDGRIAFINRAAEAILRWSRKEAVGRPIGDVYPMPGVEPGVAPCAAEPASAAGCECGPRRRVVPIRDGTERLVEETSSPIVNRHGRFVGCILVFRDVTEKARIEEDLARVQKLESLGILAAGIAHEIRNPLSGVNLYVSALERLCEQSDGLEPEEKEQIRSITDHIRSASDKIAAIVRRVMDFAKPSPRLAGRVDVNRPVEEAIDLATSALRRHGIALETALRPDLPGCLADSRLIEQVLLNLILNAVHAVQSHKGEKRIAVASSAEDGCVLVTVADSGPGVPEELREKIFDPFFTTKEGGTGIGLSFSRRVVADHGGSLSVRTSRLGGAEFRMELPVQREAAST